MKPPSIRNYWKLRIRSRALVKTWRTRRQSSMVNFKRKSRLDKPAKEVKSPPRTEASNSDDLVNSRNNVTRFTMSKKECQPRNKSLGFNETDCPKRSTETRRRKSRSQRQSKGLRSSLRLRLTANSRKESYLQGSNS